MMPILHPFGLHHTYRRMVRVDNWKFQWGFYGHLPVDMLFSPWGRGPNSYGGK